MIIYEAKQKTIATLLAISMIFLLSTSVTAIDVSKFPNQESISYTSVDILPDGGKDYTYFVNGIENHYFVPPEDFNPLTASDAELAMYYFPPRPDTNDKASYSEWIDVMSNYTGTPEPEGMVSSTEIIIEQKPTISPLSIGSRNSNIWSGYESNLGASSSKFYTQVQMDYTQPAIKSISGTCINSYWVGLGGRNTRRLVQAGTATKGTSEHYAWYEYLSDTGKTVSMIKLPIVISAGDRIHVYISFQKSNNLFSYYIANNTTGKSTSGIINNLPSSTQFDGTTAEWIVERCTSNGSPTNLGNYGSITLTNCKAMLNTSSSWTNLNSTTGLVKVTMKNLNSSSGHILSQPGNVTSSNAFTCTWRNYN